MNLIKMADRITAKYLNLPGSIKEEQVIAIKSGYYTNSALDMGQAEETRSVTCIVFLDGNTISGHARWYLDKDGKSTSGEDKVSFIDIAKGVTYGLANKIENWALDWLRKMAVERESKRGWENAKDNRRKALGNLLNDYYEVWAAKNQEHPAIPPKQPQGTIIPSEVHEPKQFKEIHDKLEASIKELYRIYSLCTESSYQVTKDKNEASKALWSASGKLVDAREEIENAIRLLK
jgi:hypothetical protein